jgi:excisionase family DNA binding protein
MEKKLLTPAQVAERLQVTERTVYTWLRGGRLRGLRAGRLWRVREEDLEAFLGAGTKGTRA